MNLLNMRLLELNNDSSIHNGLSQDSDEGTPNTKIYTNDTNKISEPTMRKFNGDIEKLEDKIEQDDLYISDTIAETFYELNRDLMLAQVQLEAIAINTIKKQTDILTETSLGTPKYQDDINVLIESSGNNIFAVIIKAIKDFIAKAKMFIARIITVHLIDYEKWVSANKDKLLEKAKTVGSQVSVSVHKWDKDILLNPIDFKKLHSCYKEFIKDTNDKDKMKEISEKLFNKYENISELSDAVYCYVLSLAVGGNPNNAKFTDRKMAVQAVKIKMKYDEKDVYMDSKRTEKYINILSNLSKKTTAAMVAIKNHSLDEDFNTLLKEVEKASNEREDKPETTKYKYYKFKFTILSAIQTACNDICRIQSSLINEYSKEIYLSLKQLLVYSGSTNNESANTISNIIGHTLHE